MDGFSLTALPLTEAEDSVTCAASRNPVGGLKPPASARHAPGGRWPPVFVAQSVR